MTDKRKIDQREQRLAAMPKPYYWYTPRPGKQLRVHIPVLVHSKIFRHGDLILLSRPEWEAKKDLLEPVDPRWVFED